VGRSGMARGFESDKRDDDEHGIKASKSNDAT
jgi:hypothetical protein